jgi:surface protein
MIALFENCIVFNQNLNNWSMSNVKTTGRMFNNCKSFNQPVNNWNTIKFNDMNVMFDNCSIFNQDLSSWNVSNVSNMYNAFINAPSFNQNLGSWNISNINSNNFQSLWGMLDNTGLSVDNYDATLNGWATQEVQNNVILGANGLEYSSVGEVGRNSLITNYNWDIWGDSLICFIKNTMILILENGIEVERKVQELKNGDMVKISTGEYKKLVFIGTKTIDITKNIDKIRIMKQGTLGNNLPNKDLLVTSGHSLLFNNLNYSNEFYKSKFYDNNVEGYYKIMSQHCKLFNYVKEDELEDIRDGNNVSYYHFCLENNDEEGQYGVYSNSVLSETIALSFSKKNYMNKN